MKCLGVGLLAAAAIFIWPWRQPWSDGNAIKKVIVSKPATGSVSNGTLSLPSPAKPIQSAAETRALIHLKLHQWLEVQASGGDDNDHSMEELEALLANGDAVDIIQSLSTDELNTPFGMDVLHQWMQADLVTATNWVAANPDAMEDLTSVVAQGWADHAVDLEVYASQLPDSAWKQNFLLETGTQLTAKDPQQAVMLAQQMTPGSAQTSFLQSVACDWISRDPTGALAWIRNVTDPTLQESLIAAAAKSYALTDPAQAAAWLVASVKSPNVVNEAALNIVSTWVITDPKAAADWATLFPNGDTKNSALNLVSNHWLQTDPGSASLWLQSFSQQN